MRMYVAGDGESQDKRECQEGDGEGHGSRSL